VSVILLWFRLKSVLELISSLFLAFCLVASFSFVEVEQNKIKFKERGENEN